MATSEDLPERRKWGLAPSLMSNLDSPLHMGSSPALLPPRLMDEPPWTTSVPRPVIECSEKSKAERRLEEALTLVGQSETTRGNACEEDNRDINSPRT